jgi:protease-4
MSDQDKNENQGTENQPGSDQTDSGHQHEHRIRDPWTESESIVNDTKETETAAASAITETDADTGKQREKWEKDLINRLAFASLNEQRRSRRWNIFFKSLLFVYLFSILFIFLAEDQADIRIGSHTALIEITGVIADNELASADNIVLGIRDAFKDKKTKGIILRINSPGGSPVQAGYINDEIYRLKEEYPDIPVYAVVSDMCASAAYYIASAADEIYADKGSLVGSIGVLMNGFGFVDAIDKLGVERRLMTAGEHKGFLDAFSPVNEQEKKHMQSMLDNIHEQFISVVKKGRGDKLADNKDLFSGLVWSGEKSVDLGLVDGLGSSSYVAREIIGEERIVDFTPRPDYFQQFAQRIGASMAQVLSKNLLQPNLQ